MGRWLSPDPSGLSYADPTNPQSLNLYSYVLNNPLHNVDPSGMECVWDDGSYDASDDPQTGSASGCSGQGGAWVDPSLFESVEGNQAGSWSGQGSSQIQFDWLTPSATANGNTWWTPDDAKAMLTAWDLGILPQQLNYGPWSVASIDMSHNWAVNQARAAYIKAGCPSSFRFNAGHMGAAIDSWGNVVMGQPDWLELQVGGFSGTITGSDGNAQFTIFNPMSESSFNGESALHGTHTSDNPNGPNGPRHNVMQTFKWTEQAMSVAKWIAASAITICFLVWLLTPLRSPINSQMIGKYHADFPWGTASLVLNADHTFRQTARTSTVVTEQVSGEWKLDESWPAHLSLAPYLDMTHNRPGKRISGAYLSVQSWGIRGVNIDVDPDWDRGFRKK